MDQPNSRPQPTELKAEKRKVQSTHPGAEGRRTQVQDVKQSDLKSSKESDPLFKGGFAKEVKKFEREYEERTKKKKEQDSRRKIVQYKVAKVAKNEFYDEDVPIANEIETPNATKTIVKPEKSLVRRSSSKDKKVVVLVLI